MVDNDPMDSEIECPRCGERVYAEVTVCPKCGLHFYGNDLDEEENESAASLGSVIWAWVNPILAGWLVSGLLAFLIHRLAGWLWADPGAAAGGQALLWLASPLGALAGAALAAFVMKGKGLAVGLGVGVLSLIPAYLLEAFWLNLASQGPGWRALTSWAAAVIAGALGGWLWEHSGRRLRVPWLEARLPSEKDLYYELLAHVHHDIDLAERLVEYERKRTPNLGRAALIRNALERLERDRR